MFRLTQNRQAWRDEEHEQWTKLRDHARSLVSQGQDHVEIPGRGGREARTAEVRMAAARVWIPAPSGTRQRFAQPVIAAWVVRIWEVNPPTGVEALEWILITSVPTNTVEEIRERRDWCACRWMDELLIKRWKSQGLVAQLSGSSVVRQMVRVWSRLLAVLNQRA